MQRDIAPRRLLDCSQQRDAPTVPASDSRPAGSLGWPLADAAMTLRPYSRIAEPERGLHSTGTLCTVTFFYSRLLELLIVKPIHVTLFSLS
jgi:hypothetical protein